MTTWETLAREASDDKLWHYVTGGGYAPAMREAAQAELTRRETARQAARRAVAEAAPFGVERLYSTPEAADMAARWRPSEEQVAAAVAKLEASGHPDWLAAVALAMPGKDHGVWELGQVVEHVPGVWVGANSFEVEPSYATARNLAAEAGRQALAGRAGTCGWAVVHADGTWAVFEDF